MHHLFLFFLLRDVFLRDVFKFKKVFWSISLRRKGNTRMKSYTFLTKNCILGMKIFQCDFGGWAFFFEKINFCHKNTYNLKSLKIYPLEISYKFFWEINSILWSSNGHWNREFLVKIIHAKYIFFDSNKSIFF